MSNRMTYVVIRDTNGAVPYWAIDVSLPEVRARYKRLSGKFPSKKASIIAFTGSFEDLNELSVNDMGDIEYRKNLVMAVLQ